MKNYSKRQWAIAWMYGLAAMHFMVGLLLPWLSRASIFDGYHHSIERIFWGEMIPPPAHAEQLWWIALFGPTIQNVAIWMAALTHLGAKHKSRFAWAALLIGIAVWAPQDMLYSLTAEAWPHVWLDSAMLLMTLPVLAWLWWTDGAADITAI